MHERGRCGGCGHFYDIIDKRKWNFLGDGSEGLFILKEEYLVHGIKLVHDKTTLSFSWTVGCYVWAIYSTLSLLKYTVP